MVLNKIQQEQIKNTLSQLGFSEKEGAVYLSALQNSNSSVLTIARDTELSRGTVFDIVENLKKKGYLAEVRKGKKRRLIVENPTNRFYSFLDQQHYELEKTKNLVEDVLPLIKTINANEDFNPQIRVYAGETGFRKVWDEIFSYQGKEFLSITRIETLVKFCGRDFLDRIQERKMKLGFSSRAINEDSLLSRELKAKDKEEKRETFLVPEEFKFPTGEIIFGDKIAMFSTKQENIILIIESKDFAETHRIYFEMLWKFLEERGCENKGVGN